MEQLELAIDALDIPAIRPFWKAALAYVDEPGSDGPGAGIVDPPGSYRPCGSSRWTPRARSATGCCTWTGRDERE